MFDPVAHYRMKRAYINEVRANTVCASCGAQPIEWHSLAHAGKPDLRVAKLARFGMQRIKDELARCTPLCRPCHKAAHGGQWGPGRWQAGESGNPRGTWRKGQSGNPRGSSKRQRGES